MKIWEKIDFSDVKISVNKITYNLHKCIIIHSGKLKSLIDISRHIGNEILELEGENENNFEFILTVLYSIYEKSYLEKQNDYNYKAKSLKKQIEQIYLLDEYIITLKSIWNEQLCSFKQEMVNVLINVDIGQNINYSMEYEKTFEDEKSKQIDEFNLNIDLNLDELNTILYDTEFFYMIQKYDKIAYDTDKCAGNLSEYIIESNEGSPCFRTIIGSLRRILKHVSIKNYPFILYFIFEYCLKIIYWQDSNTFLNYTIRQLNTKYTKDILLNITNYIAHHFYNQITSVHNLLKHSGYPHLTKTDLVDEHLLVGSLMQVDNLLNYQDPSDDYYTCYFSDSDY